MFLVDSVVKLFGCLVHVGVDLLQVLVEDLSVWLSLVLSRLLRPVLPVIHMDETGMEKRIKTLEEE